MIGFGGLGGVNWIRRYGVGRRCLLGFIAFVVGVGLFVGCWRFERRLVG